MNGLLVVKISKPNRDSLKTETQEAAVHVCLNDMSEGHRMR